MYINEERRAFFFSRVKRESGHWLWTGTKTDRGYAKITIGGKVIYAHRVSYCIAHKLDIPDIEHLTILKTCQRNDCVSPAHLIAKPKPGHIQTIIKIISWLPYFLFDKS